MECHFKGEKKQQSRSTEMNGKFQTYEIAITTMEETGKTQKTSIYSLSVHFHKTRTKRPTMLMLVDNFTYH